MEIEFSSGGKCVRHVTVGISTELFLPYPPFRNRPTMHIITAPLFSALQNLLMQLRSSHKEHEKWAERDAHTDLCVAVETALCFPPRPQNNAIGNFSLDRDTSLMTIFLDNTCHNYLQRFFNVSSCLFANKRDVVKATGGKKKVSRHLLLDVVWFSLSVVNYLQKCSYHKCKSYKSRRKSIQERCKLHSC